MGSRHTPATSTTVSLPATVAPEAIYAPCVAVPFVEVETVYVYAVLDVLQITIDEMIVHVEAVAPLSTMFVTVVEASVPKR